MANNETLFEQAAELISRASGILVTAGAGMGVDSGLADFRGAEGFWRTYPPLRSSGIRFEEIANPAAFARDPELAWGFYGHRLLRYRQTEPHRGFAILREIAACLPDSAFALTSNVDGHFQKSGFAEASVAEVHGSIHYLQCFANCGSAIWPAESFTPVVDEARCRLVSPLPVCPHCGGLARPNILMFGDWEWLEARFQAQEAQAQAWRRAAGCPVTIELGAGKQVPTIRYLGERSGYPLIRINPRDFDVPDASHLSLATGALAALDGIRAALEKNSFFRQGSIPR